MNILVEYFAPKPRRGKAKRLYAFTGQITDRAFNRSIRRTTNEVINEQMTVDERLIEIHCRIAKKIVVTLEKE